MKQLNCKMQKKGFAFGEPEKADSSRSFGMTMCGLLMFGFAGADVFAGAESIDFGEQGRTFYRQFFIAGGPIVWFVLLPMSIAAGYLAIDLFISTRRKRLLPSNIASEIATAAVVHGRTMLLTKLAGRMDLISRAILRAVEQARQIGGNAHSIRQLAAEALQERGMQLMRKAQWCQIIGSVAPMVGLFGTVYGMIRAFNLLGQSAEGPRYDMLAEAISMALVTTFWGLLVGIPALFLYGYFQTRIEAVISEAAIETEAVLGRILKDGTTLLFRREATPSRRKTAETEKSEPSRKGAVVREKNQSPQAHTEPDENKKPEPEPEPSTSANE